MRSAGGAGQLLVLAALSGFAPAAARSSAITAMIFDPVGDELLAQTIEHFVLMLPRDVPVVWVTDHQLSDAELDIWRASDTLAQALAAGKVQIRTVAYNLTRNEYNRQLRQPEFWLKLPQAGQVLIFERDAVLCPGASARLRNFSHFDFIGAPWRPTVPWCASRKLRPEQCCCNSGLSLSSPPKLAQLLRQAQQEPHQNRFKPTNIDMYVLEYSPDVPTFTKPRAGRAQHFSVETMWDGIAPPVGVHKPWFGWGTESWANSKIQLRKLLRACPAVLRLCPYAHASSNNPHKDHGPPAQKFVRTFCREYDRSDYDLLGNATLGSVVPLSKSTPLGYAMPGSSIAGPAV